MDLAHLEQTEAAASRARHFTVSQASDALVLVDRIVRDAQTAHARLTELQKAPGQAGADGARRPLSDLRDELIQKVARLRNCLRELEQLGVELRNCERGIVDFPAFARGREIRLCWRLGEARVEHWHELDEGFARRRSIESLYVDQPAAAGCY